MSDFETKARLQAVESSLKFRYDLTSEYADLKRFIASTSTAVKGGSAGHTTTSHKTETYWTGSRWATRTITSSKFHPGSGPTVLEQQAARKRQLQVQTAKKRLAQIKSEIAATPGGWATDQDYIANLTAQQALTQVGTPDWYAFQSQIDAHKQKIQADAVLARQGIKVAYAPVASETSTDLNVGAGERPVGLTQSQATRVAAYQKQISDYQRAIDGGSLTPEAEAAYASAIELAQRNIQATLSTAQAPARKAAVARSSGGGASSPAARSGGGGGGTGLTAASAAAYAPHTTARGTTKAGGGQFPTSTPTKGPLQKITSSQVVTIKRTGQQVVTTVKGVGLSKGMSPTAFDDLHSAFTVAVHNGATSFRNPIDGKSYAIPTNPDDRLTMMRYLDDKNVDLKYAELAAAEKQGLSQNSIARKRSAFNNAKATANTNLFYILDTSSPGVIRDTKGSATKITATTGRTPTNTLAFAVDLMDVTKHHAEQEFSLAQAAYDRGDYAAAASHLATGQAEIERVGPKLEAYASQVNATVAALTAGGGKEPAAIKGDLARLNAWDTDLGEAAKPAADISKSLFGTPNDPGSGILAMANGVVVHNSRGDIALNPGWVRSVDEQGNIAAKQLPVVGYDNTGKPVYGEAGKVHVQVKTGQTFVDVLAPFKVGSIGSITMGNGQKVPINGKLVTIKKPDGTSETWTENPFQPGVWIPGGGAAFKIPNGATAFTVGGQGAQTLPGVPAGTTAIAFEQGGSQFILSPDAATGTYNLWQNVDGTPQLLGAAGTEDGNPNAQVAGILNASGFGYDNASLSPDQQFVVNLKTSGLNPTGGGAWFGATQSDLSSFFVKPQTSPPSERYVQFGADTGDISYRLASPDYGSPTVNPYTGFVTGAVGQRPPTATGPAAAPAPPPGTPTVNPYTGFNTGNGPIVNPYTGFVTPTVAPDPYRPLPAVAPPPHVQTGQSTGVIGYKQVAKPPPQPAPKKGIILRKTGARVPRPAAAPPRPQPKVNPNLPKAEVTPKPRPLPTPVTKPTNFRGV